MVGATLRRWRRHCKATLMPEALVFEELPMTLETPGHGELPQPFTFRRARVPGGWIVVLPQLTFVSATERRPTGQEMALFYSDPIHRWDGRSLAPM